MSAHSGGSVFHQSLPVPSLIVPPYKSDAPRTMIIPMRKVNPRLNPKIYTEAIDAPIVASAHANPLRMLSAYLITMATHNPPNALLITMNQTMPVNP